jgi:hypothetical protein
LADQQDDDPGPKIVDLKRAIRILEGLMELVDIESRLGEEKADGDRASLTPTRPTNSTKSKPSSRG